MKKTLTLILSMSLCYSAYACNKSDNNASGEATQEAVADPMQDKGVGPVTSVELGALDNALAAKGEKIFSNNCKACHKIEKRKIGPALKGVTKHRSPEWIMNMILNPERMVKENEAAKKLLMEYSAPMSNQNLSQDEARAVLEYFRKIDAGS